MRVVEVGGHSRKHRVGFTLWCFFYLTAVKSRVFQWTLAQPITIFSW